MFWFEAYPYPVVLADTLSFSYVETQEADLDQWSDSVYLESVLSAQTESATLGSL